MSKIKKKLEKLKNPKVLVIVALITFALLFIIFGSIDAYKSRKVQEEVDKKTEEHLKELSGSTDNTGESNDSLLMSMQDDLISSYGKVPEGYIWDLDGSLLSLGVKDMSAEDVLYSYFNGLKTLDFSTVQKFSRDSIVVDSYESFFDETNKNTDYDDSFMRNMYRDCLLSLRINGIVNTSVFAENKQVFTVKVNMLDLTQKDFWEKDKDTIYRNLRVYNSDQSDSTKGDIYLYDYISSYYESDNAARRDVTFDITLQKYPDLDTGWLVSIDTDVDSACRYADGKLVVNYIKDTYNSESRYYFDTENSKVDVSKSESSKIEISD